MPVIGRLDRQVEDVIISPVSKRRRDEAPRADAGETDDRQPEPPAPEAPPPTHTPPAGESSARSGELPVWLL